MKLLLVTHSRYEHYVDLGIDVLDEMWPTHPEIIACTDRGGFRYRNKIVSSRSDWAPMMLDCVGQLMAGGRLTPEEHVLLILEDHVPHASVDHVMIGALSDFLSLQGNGYLNLGGYGAAEEIGQARGTTIHRMEHHAYSSLHPALWSARHLRRSLEHALSDTAGDPWAFERIRFPDATHFTTGERIWPSSHSGFVVTGVINVTAIKKFNHGSLLALRRRLVYELAFQAPASLWAKALRRWGRQSVA